MLELLERLTLACAESPLEDKGARRDFLLQHWTVLKILARCPSDSQSSPAVIAYAHFTLGERLQPGPVPQPVSLDWIRQVTTVEQWHETGPATRENDSAQTPPTRSLPPPSKFSAKRLFRRTPTAPPSDSMGAASTTLCDQPDGCCRDRQLDPSHGPSHGVRTVIASTTALPPRQRRFPFL